MLESSALRDMERRIVKAEAEILRLKTQRSATFAGNTVLSGSLSPHGFLSAAHSDTDPAGPQTDDLVYGENGSSKWGRLKQGVNANFARFYNKSGGAIVEGDLVILDVTNDFAFTTTTVLADQRALGVAAESIADNAQGYIKLFGGSYIATLVADSGGVVRGDFIVASDTPKLVADSGTLIDSTVSIPQGAIGVAVSGVVGSGPIKAFMWEPWDSSGSGGGGGSMRSYLSFGDEISGFDFSP